MMNTRRKFELMLGLQNEERNNHNNGGGGGGDALPRLRTTMQGRRRLLVEEELQRVLPPPQHHHEPNHHTHRDGGGFDRFLRRAPRAAPAATRKAKAAAAEAAAARVDGLKYPKDRASSMNMNTVGMINKQVQLERLRGSSRGRLPYQAAKRVNERYGKWVTKLESQPKLSKKLHEEGSEALRTFGYEPFRIFMDTQDNSKKDDEVIQPFVCNEEVVCSI